MLFFFFLQKVDHQGKNVKLRDEEIFYWSISVQALSGPPLPYDENFFLQTQTYHVSLEREKRAD